MTYTLPIRGRASSKKKISVMSISTQVDVGVSFSGCETTLFSRLSQTYPLQRDT